MAAFVSPIGEAKEAVATIVLALQQYSAEDTGITADEIIEGGSLGCGTAIPNNFDIDLVIYSRKIFAEELLIKEQRKKLLKKLGESLEKRLDKAFGETRITTRSLKFKFHFTKEHYLKVDLLISPFWKSSTELSKFIREKSKTGIELSPLSAGASKWQTKFICHQPERYKEYIKRAKYWKKFDWPGDKAGKPSSFLITMLTLEALQRSGMPPHGKIPQFEKKTIVNRLTGILQDMVKEHRQLCINMGEAASSPGKAPCVTDPGNSANNLYYTAFGDKSEAAVTHEWDELAKKIDHLDFTTTFESIGLR